MGQRVANRQAQLARQVGALEHRCPRKDVGTVAVERRGADHVGWNIVMMGQRRLKRVRHLGPCGRNNPAVIANEPTVLKTPRNMNV